MTYRAITRSSRHSQDLMAVQVLDAKRRMERLVACDLAEVSVNIFPRALSEFYFANCHIPNREHPI